MSMDLDPDAKRDPGYSIDALRKELAARSRLNTERWVTLKYEIQSIKGLLIIVAAILAYIAWQLSK